ncbi:MAG: hypothetical protein AB8B94_16590 [Hyphomicrobiales bacterium]
MKYKIFNPCGCKALAASAAIAAIVGSTAPAMAQTIGCAGIGPTIINLFNAEAAGYIPSGTASVLTTVISQQCAAGIAAEVEVDLGLALCGISGQVISPTSSGGLCGSVSS